MCLNNSKYYFHWPLRIEQNKVHGLANNANVCHIGQYKLSILLDKYKCMRQMKLKSSPKKHGFKSSWDNMFILDCQIKYFIAH